MGSCVVVVHLNGRRTGVGVDGVVKRPVEVMLALELSSGRTRTRPDLVPQNPTDGAHRWHIVLVTHTVSQQLVSNLPREDPRVPLLVRFDVLHDVRGCDARFGASDGAGQDGSGLVVAREDLGDAAVGDAQLAGDVARPHAELRQLHDAQPNRSRQRPPVDEDTAELVHLPVANLLCKI